MDLPSFFDESSADQLFLPRYDLIAREARAAGLAPASSDAIKIGVFAIDMQVGFCHPQGTLFVPGALDDTVRACRFIYRNIDRITNLYFSLDTHRAYQIFHPLFWADPRGNHPPALTVITQKDIDDGRWTPTRFRDEAIDYVKQLDARGGKYSLCIWPFHTMLGSLDHALMPILFECALYHTIGRQNQCSFEAKGEHPLTENFSVLSPEVKEVAGTKVGQFNTGLLNALMENDRIYILGEASSHCVKETITDIQKVLSPALLKKIYLLQDCMSPVPAIPGVDFPAIAALALEGFKSAGMNLASSTDPIV
ncbi:MAG: nicotinamidase [Firmicutes bacterium]|nr:nicotinamidase [Bacillota bacterium]